MGNTFIKKRPFLSLDKKKRVKILPIKGANIEPNLAMEQAKERATDLTTVGNNSVVYRYTIPQQT